MTTIRRLTHSCVLITGDDGTVIIDPDSFTWSSGIVDLDSIGDVQRILVTHEHQDHVHPDFVKWVRDRGTDITIHGNANVAALLAPDDIEVVDSNPTGVTSEDNMHGVLPNGMQPPNRSYTYGNVTSPGDSFDMTTSGEVLLLPLFVPWGLSRDAVLTAERLRPKVVIPAHDFYLSDGGRAFIGNFIGGVLNQDGMEFVPVAYGESYSF